MRILVTGASGSGTTTLARALATHLHWTHLDLDDYYWLPTRPPFQAKRDPAQRLSTCLRDLQAAPHAVVSGSMVRWGQALEDAFDLIVFLYLPADIRVERLRQRETEHLGAADPVFLEWAALYDDGPPEGRSLAKHQAWLAQRRCPVLRLEGDLSVDERKQRVLAALAGDRTTRLTRTLPAPPAAVYRALTDAALVRQWRFPDGMRIEVHEFDAREGGRSRVSLTYEDPAQQGKTTARTDTYHGTFRTLREAREVVEVLEFETSDPAMAGEMRISYALAARDGGTELAVTHENVPPGVRLADNELGWAMALDRLQALLQGRLAL